MVVRRRRVARLRRAARRVTTRPGSRRWLARQARDPFTRAARRDGWRSRAVYKLEAMDRKWGLLARGARALDLGAAPGGWSQYAAARVGPGGRVVAVDLAALRPLAGVAVVRGDIAEPAVRAAALAALGGPAQLVMSDLAPHVTGVAAIDGPRALALAEAALEVAIETLAPDGRFLVKLFEGEGVDAYAARLGAHFASVRRHKPAASRAQSRELYALASRLRPRHGV